MSQTTSHNSFVLLHHCSCLFITIAWCWFSSLIVLVHHSYCLPLSQQFCVGSPIFLSRFITTVLCWFTTLLVSLYHFRFVLIHSLLVPLAKPSSLVTSLLDTMSLYLEQAVVSPMLMESAQVFMIAIKRSCYDWLCCP